MYRPSYPVEAIDYLYDTIGFQAGSQIADIGAGTGIFTKLLLERGSLVTAVEPNQAMREAGEKVLGKLHNFRAVSGAAEATGLEANSVDYIVSAQAFHWFNRAEAQLEFRRILRQGGKCVLIWNSRLTEGSPFLVGYEQLLHTYGLDYKAVNHRNISEEELASFFKTGDLHVARFMNRQEFDYEGLQGRLLSSSYSPMEGHPNYEPMMAALRELFDKSAENGKVGIDYETEVFWGEV
jgi:ubiquinone/menaquinone biosynthesis C-methylase UbiE